MSTATLDDLLTGGGKTAKFEKIGQVWSGPVVKAEPRQATNFDTGKPEFWDDGQPKMQAVVSIQTDLHEDDTDDGVRAIYVKMWGDQKKAFRLAAQQAGGAPAPGDHFTATYYADGEKPQRGFAPKLFRYEIKKGSSLDAALGVTTQNAPSSQPSGFASSDQDAQIAVLISKGLTDEQIASVMDGVTVQDAATVRLVQAANSNKGF